jgi:hypothetical protein
MRFDLERVRSDVRSARTEDLLDRVTVYRAGMEAEAIEVIEQELYNRGLTAAEIARHAEERQDELLANQAGCAGQCSFCRQPAVAEGWGWHRLWKKIPVFPRRFYYCRDHQP